MSNLDTRWSMHLPNKELYFDRNLQLSGKDAEWCSPKPWRTQQES